MADSTSTTHHDDVAKLAKLLGDFDFAMLTTIDRRGPSSGTR